MTRNQLDDTRIIYSRCIFNPARKHNRMCFNFPLLCQPAHDSLTLAAHGRIFGRQKLRCDLPSGSLNNNHFAFDSISRTSLQFKT